MTQNPDFDFGFDGSECEPCGGKCCTGESGYIFASIDELLCVSDFLNIPFDEFTQKYVKKVGYRFSFLEKKSMEGIACIFFDDLSKKCLIYEVRPEQCKSFPFWQSYKTDRVSEGEIEKLCGLCRGVKCLKIF
ncbi:YkgJ family cysteine cluster protein [Helicobacter sp. 13S00477-4]|uniref:YkgJ family cysteine cluster protein n=1 Tax=Helicobacter sp. 13S00477-4 TaxID=1905759 RepID=UPI000BA50BB3|nr:YkgJ family cysteine cluster protein [Helicobacter sp. 13S00477-4]PAF50507.1 zinc/iron-chelating domain-containing protein [Helicobacter sp. 13S00477-4]